MEQHLYLWKRLRIFLSILVVVISAAAIAGWLLNIQLLKSVSDAYTAMKFNTAFGLFLLAIALLMLNRIEHGFWAKLIFITLNLIVFTLGLLTLMQYVTGLELGIDELFLKDDDFAVKTTYPGRMSLVTASLFIIATLSLFMSVIKHRFAALISQILGLLILLYCFTPLLGYLFDYPALVQFGNSTAIALNTALCFFAIGLIVILSTDNEGFMEFFYSRHATAWLAKRLISVSLLMPFLIVWLIIHFGRIQSYDSPVFLQLVHLVLLIVFIALSVLLIQSLQLSDKAEKLALKQAEEWHDLMQYIILHAPHSIAIFNTEMNFVYVSENFKSDYGVTSQEIIGKNHYEVFPDIPQRWREVHQKAMQGEVIICEDDVFERADGSKHFVRYKCMPWYKPDHSIGGIVLFAEITNQRKKMESALEKTAHQLEMVLQHAGDGIFSVDASGNATMINRAASMMLGYEATDILGKQMHAFHHHSRSDGSAYDAADCPIHKSYKSGKIQLVDNEIFWRKDGSSFPVEYVSTPIYVDGLVAGAVVSFKDISQRLQAEQKLDESRALLQAIIDNTPSLIYVVDTEGRFMLCNKPMEELLMKPSAYLIGKSRSEVMDKISAAQHQNNDLEVLKAKKPIVFEESNQTLSAERNYLTIKFPLLDKNNEIFGICGISTDFTDRKKTELALAQAMQRLEVLMSNLPGMAYRSVNTPEWPMTFVSEGSFDLTGYKAEMFVQAEVRFGDLIHPDDQQRVFREVQESLKNKKHFFLDYRIVDAHGNERFVWEKGKFVESERSDQVEELEGFIMDITDRKAAENENKRLNKKLHELIRAIRSLAEATDKHDVYKIVTSASRLLTNAIGSAFVLRDHGNCLYVEENADIPLWKGSEFPLDNCISGWVMQHKTEAIIEDIYQDERVPVQYYSPTPVKALVAIPVGKKEAVAAITTYFATNHIPVEEDIHLLYTLADAAAIALENLALIGNLETQVIRRTSQLEAANRELEAFSYSVSHDLRAPLRAIDGFARILLEDYGSKLDNEGLRVCNVITTNVRKMSKLIDDLLSFSRIGRGELQKSTIDIDTLVRSLFHELTSAEQRENIHFATEKLPAIKGDPPMIRQMWMNLIGNAVKFTSGQNKATIIISAKDKGDHIQYCIADNGVGFSMDYVSKLFGVFQRLHSVSEFEGTGVGLAIVQRIAHRHDGIVSAEGAVNEGAKFYISLPK